MFKYEFVANLPVSLPMKEFWKSVNIWGSYGQELCLVFFDSWCRCLSVLCLWRLITDYCFVAVHKTTTVNLISPQLLLVLRTPFCLMQNCRSYSLICSLCQWLRGLSVGCVICCLQFDWYTKRASLATVYTSAEVYMIQDSSHEFENTWNFVDRQLACYVWLGQRVRELWTACTDLQ